MLLPEEQAQSWVWPMLLEVATHPVLVVEVMVVLAEVLEALEVEVAEQVLLKMVQIGPATASEVEVGLERVCLTTQLA